MYSRKARTRELRTTAYHGVPQRFRKRSQNGRRPSLPETNSMAGRACVRNVILQTVSLRGSPRPGDNPKPKGRSGKTNEAKNKRKKLES